MKGRWEEREGPFSFMPRGIALDGSQARMGEAGEERGRKKRGEKLRPKSLCRTYTYGRYVFKVSMPRLPNVHSGHTRVKVCTKGRAKNDLQ